MIVRNIVGSAGGRSFGAARWEICSSAHTANEREIEDMIKHSFGRESYIAGPDGVT